MVGKATHAVPTTRISMVLVFVKAESIAMKRIAEITTTIVRAVVLFRMLQIITGANRKTRVRSAIIIRMIFAVKEPENIYTDESLEILLRGPLGCRLACARKMCRECKYQPFEKFCRSAPTCLLPILPSAPKFHRAEELC
jgi:hypothetical protein